MKRRMMMAVVAATLMLNASAQETRQLGIDEMFMLIEQNSAMLRQQKTGVEQAQEGVKMAKRQRLPDVNVSLNASYLGNALLTDRSFSNAHGLRSPHLGNEFMLQAQQVVYAGGALNAGVKMAKIGAEQAAVGANLSRQDLRFLALGQYLDLQKMANREQVLEENIKLTEQLVAQIKERQQQGVALKNDITRYELQLQQLRLNLTKLRNQRNILNHQLCNTLGLPTATVIVPTDDATATVYEKAGEIAWQDMAASNSPQLQMAELEQQMAKQREKMTKSDLLPKVVLIASNDFNGPITFELPPIDRNLNIWFVGISLKYSLSSLYKSNKRISQARLATRQAKESMAVARQQVDNQVQEAYTYYLQSYTELETQEKNVELARQNYEVINNRYLNQLALVTDMIDASNIKLDAELGEADARINIAYAYYRMRYTAGKM